MTHLRVKPDAASSILDMKPKFGCADNRRAAQHKQRYDYTPRALLLNPASALALTQRGEGAKSKNESRRWSASWSEQQEDDYAGCLAYGRRIEFKQDGAAEGLQKAKNTTSTESDERFNCNRVEQDEERACRTEAARIEIGMGFRRARGAKEERVRDRGPKIVTVSKEKPTSRPEAAREGWRLERGAEGET